MSPRLCPGCRALDGEHTFGATCTLVEEWQPVLQLAPGAEARVVTPWEGFVRWQRGNGAVLSHDGLYRWRLWRDLGDPARRVCWVLLNPSTADGLRQDATLRRLEAYTVAWGYGALEVVNLYAYRAVYPAELWRAAAAGQDVEGRPHNLEVIRAAARVAEIVVLGWGAHAAKRPEHVRAVDRLLQAERWAAERLHFLALTQTGQPAHPLRLAKQLEPVPWVPAVPRGVLL